MEDSRPTVPLVLSVGGSVLVTGQNDEEYLRQLATLLRRIGHEQPLVVTTGGGKTARDYIRLGRAQHLTEIELDELGILVTRLHAHLLTALIGPPTPPHPPVTLVEAVRDLQRCSPVILGGTEPGHTTDGVAALLAVRLRAPRVVNATSVTGVYDKDPRKHAHAQRIDAMSWGEFRNLMASTQEVGQAGQEFLFDALGAELLARARIPLAIVNGRDLASVESALLGRPFLGSRIGPWETGEGRGNGNPLSQA